MDSSVKIPPGAAGSGASPVPACGDPAVLGRAFCRVALSQKRLNPNYCPTGRSAATKLYVGMCVRDVACWISPTFAPVMDSLVREQMNKMVELFPRSSGS